MTTALTRVPLSARGKDMAMFIYFVSHIPATMLMDIVPLYPSFLAPLIQPLLEFQDYYVETFRDPFMGDRSLIWFNTFLHMEGLFQLPFFAFAAWALFHNKRSIALWICVYSAHVITTVIPILTTLNLSKDTAFPFAVSEGQKLFLTCLYTPWVLFPLWMLVECFQRVRSYEAEGAIKKKAQ
ncbi:Transmembrane protein 97 [Linnemannia exigua]|uniref:Efficient mitochondria targeting-associated protein 19 n=1 Tax=Linnemannia exigua TaxID=604196 RepID=A0AAD4H908_9FUNG|nr:Transmembrane protein 97 [Linnemannia exigua]